MNAKEFMQSLAEHPIIASVKDEDGLACALDSGCRVIFTLYGDILTIPDIVRRLKAAGKIVLTHVDFIEGLASRDVSIDYLAKYIPIDGILSTKVGLIRRAAHHGLLAVQRCFLLDSLSLANVSRQYAAEAACAMEVLPGVMPKVIRRLHALVDTPIITGGLISDKEDVMQVLAAGACAVSATDPDIWFL